jgi:hypothetical protein
MGVGWSRGCAPTSSIFSWKLGSFANGKRRYMFYFVSLLILYLPNWHIRKWWIEHVFICDIQKNDSKNPSLYIPPIRLLKRIYLEKDVGCYSYALTGSF